jgi:hypothetical protein
LILIQIKHYGLLLKRYLLNHSFNTKPTPPCEPDKASALGFNIIKPTSGKYFPYDPEGVYPGVVEADTGSDVVALPFDPLTISNTLPASVNVRVVTSLELSVNCKRVASVPSEPDSTRLNVPGNSFSLYLALLTFNTKISLEFVFPVPKLKFVFSSPFTNVLN